MRWVAFALVIALGTQPAVAAAPQRVRGASDKPCARLELDFFPRRIEPGQAMDSGFGLANCATFTERLVVVLESTGPCPFLPSSRSVYVLMANRGFGSSGLGFGPSCSGVYRTKGTVSFRGRVLDRAHASFVVRHQAA
jgi:hypothetical protein